VREPVMKPHLLASVFGAVVVAIVYFVAARLSLALLEKPDGVAVFWPAAGVASGVLIGFGAGARWPVVAGVMAATLGANLLGDRNLPSTLFFAAANAGEAVLAAGLIQWIYGAPFDLNDLRRVLGLFVATIVGTSVSGIVGVLGFILFHTPTAPVLTVWLHWVASDGLGTITIAPLVIGLASLIRDPPARRELAEAALALSVVSAVCACLIFLPNQPWTIELAIASLSPLCVWIAARLRPVFTAAATFIWAITIVLTTTFAVGIFGDPRLAIDERILSAQATILATSFGALVLAALFTERRRHEAAILERERRLEEALRAGGVMAFDWDLSAANVRYSQNAVQILGIGAQAIRSAEWLDRIHPDDLPQVTACIDGARLGGGSHSAIFRYMRTDGGGEVWLEQIAVTQFSPAGKPVRVHGLAADITERKRFEEEISRARKTAELADRAKSSFLAAASHDLRQPLQTLRFLHGALEHHHRDGEVCKLVAGMGRSLDTMSSILSSLLDVNQLESGSLRPSRSDFTVNEMFTSLEADFLPAIEERGLRLRLVRSALVVQSDRRMLEEMIRNLLSNAVRYTDHGTILLGCRRAGGKVRIEVWDSGIGITEDQLPLIFEEYYQSADGAERGGFGLGLAIVRRLAKILDHRLGVRSARGRGTGFSIEVPCGQQSVTTQGSLTSQDHQRDSFAGTILVVEDESSVRTSLNRLLKAKGIGAMVVATGDDALALIREKDVSPDLILCDYNLRGSANGLESIKTLRAALARDVPAIVMTGDTRVKTMEAITSHDISVLIKPFVADELMQLIRRLHCGENAHVGK